MVQSSPDDPPRNGLYQRATMLASFARGEKMSGDDDRGRPGRVGSAGRRRPAAAPSGGLQSAPSCNCEPLTVAPSGRSIRNHVAPPRRGPRRRSSHGGNSSGRRAGWAAYTVRVARRCAASQCSGRRSGVLEIELHNRKNAHRDQAYPHHPRTIAHGGRTRPRSPPSPPRAAPPARTRTRPLVS